MDRRNALAARWGGLVARRRWAFLAGWAVALVVMGLLASTTSRLLSPAGFSTDTEANRTAQTLQRQFPERRGPVLIVVLHSDRTPATDPAFAGQVAAWRTDLDRLVGPDPARAVEGPIPGSDGRTVMLLVVSNQTGDTFVKLGADASAIHPAGPATAELGGYAAVYDHFISDSERDLRQSELISLPIAVVLLLLVFGGLVAGALPVLTGLATVTVAVALLGAAARLHTVSIFSLNVTSVVGLGLGIDYSLLVVNRFREELRSGRTVEAAVATTVSTAGVATVVSGAIVLIGFGALTLSHLNILWSMGLGGALVVAVSVVASLTLIPALLAVFGAHVDRFALPFARAGTESRSWQVLARAVMRRPALFIVVSVAVCAVLIWPARNITPGVVGAESLPPGDSARTAQALAESQFGMPAHPPAVVVARGVDGPAAAARVESVLVAAAGGQRVTGPADFPPERVALLLRPPYAVFEVAQPGGDNDPATRAWLDGIRHAPWPPGVTVQIGGQAAAFEDFLSLLEGDFPLIVGTVLLLTLALLGVAFRSVVLPVKAVLMNLLSVGAAMGVLTWAFQEGHLSGPLGFTRLGFVDSTVPVLIFAALFGLSMDYEVFLLSRIREEWLAGRSNTDAVAHGLERTGRIITSAALILVLVVSTLALSSLTLNKSFGVTFAVAIALDATVIRLLLVPAMMRVLGDLNWWPDRRRGPGSPG